VHVAMTSSLVRSRQRKNSKCSMSRLNMHSDIEHWNTSCSQSVDSEVQGNLGVLSK
jgi:hypothetical protein